jgi:nucleoside-diphosphate-sugar epimerase
MRVFVTGGSSPLGDVVIPRLVDAGLVCTCLVRSDRAADRVLRSGGIALEGDLSNDGWWAESKKHDSLLHMAGITLGDLIAPALENDQPTVVVSSASATNQQHPRRAEIITCENRLLDREENLSILRPTMIYGSPRDRNMRKLAAAINRFPIIPRLVGGGQIQPIASIDVADAILARLSILGPLIIEIGGPDRVPLGALISMLAKFLHKSELNMSVPLEPISVLIRTTNLGSHSRIAHAIEMLSYDRAVDAVTCQLLGRQPTTLEQGLPKALRSYGLI